jgi:polyketide cyclase/dehydrase/lipid transport protein
VSRRSFLCGAAALGSSFVLGPPAWGRDLSVAERYQFRAPGRATDTGGALIAVQAPLDRVVAVLTDFRKYSDILPRLELSRVVARGPKGTDVYLRAPILGGVVSIWGIARFSQPKPWGQRGRRIVGRLIRGNLDGWSGQWKVWPCGPERVLLRLEMFFDLQIPLPDVVVIDNVMWSCQTSVTAVRDMAECGKPRE